MKMFDDFMDFLAMDPVGRWFLRGMLILAVIMSILTLIGIAQAVPLTCFPRAEMLDRLAQTYKETPIAIGVTSSGGVIEVLTTGDGDTWTIILSDPSGTSCLIAAGEGWRSLTPSKDTPI